jgi:hypothetical protein
MDHVGSFVLSCLEVSNTVPLDVCVGKKHGFRWEVLEDRLAKATQQIVVGSWRGHEVISITKVLVYHESERHSREGWTRKRWPDVGLTPSSRQRQTETHEDCDEYVGLQEEPPRDFSWKRRIEWQVCE